MRHDLQKSSSSVKERKTTECSRLSAPSSLHFLSGLAIGVICTVFVLSSAGTARYLGPPCVKTGKSPSSDGFSHLRPAFLGWTEADYAAAACGVAWWRAAPTDTWTALGFPTSAAWKNSNNSIFNYAPPRTRSCELKRYGSAGDGGKFLCSDALAALQPGCVIYSLGSNSQFDFEVAMLAATPCVIHTFDCTSDDKKKPTDPRVVFHQKCLGGRRLQIANNNTTSARNLAKFFTLVELATQNGHTHIDILKMDIEGGEYPVFASLADTPAEAAHLLPDQISFELHLSHSVNRENCGSTSCDFWHMWSNILDLGYVPVSREDNAPCTHCVEYTLARAFSFSPQQHVPPAPPLS